MSATPAQPTQPTQPTQTAAGAGGSSAGTSQSAQASTTPSRSSAAALSSAPWKSDTAEETVKTRRNALRVIVQKMRTFWPADTEVRLTERATLLEKGVYDVTSSKADYIQRLQRDLGLLSNKRDLEKKHMRTQMQQAGDLCAQYAHEDKNTGMVAPHLSADAKAKFTQKIYAMEKKHSNKFILLKMTDDRLKQSQPDLQMRKLLERFKSQYNQRDKGPFDLRELNDIDHQLDRQQAAAPLPAIVRMAPSRETADKQNDRTQQIGLRMADKIRKLNRERPLVIAELSWTIERDGPFTEPAPPPELSIALDESKRNIPDRSTRSLARSQDVTGQKRKSQHGAGQSDVSTKKPKHETGKHAGGDKLDVTGESSSGDDQGRDLLRLSPHRSVGGSFVPSVRDGHLQAPTGIKNKGYTDVDAPNDNDSGDQQPLAEHRQAPQPRGTLPQTLRDAEQSIKLAALTISHPDFLAPLPLSDALAATAGSKAGGFVVVVGGGGGCLLRQQGKSLGLDGVLHQHEVAIEVLPLHSAGQDPEVARCEGSERGWELAWDAKCACLRSLPVRVRVAPDCGLDANALLAGTAEMRQLSPALWLREVVGGVARHLRCLETVTREVQQLLTAHDGLLSASLCKARQGAGLSVTCRCCAGGVPLNTGMIITVVPGLGSAEGYPNVEPQWGLTGLAGGMQSEKQFRREFRKRLEEIPAPRSMTDLVETMLETCGMLIIADFGSLDPTL